MPQSEELSEGALVVEARLLMEAEPVAAALALEVKLDLGDAEAVGV